ncbi:MAG: PfkB family carbohydrate kinase [Pseudomonadota bacterium]
MSVMVVGALHLDVLVRAPHLPRRDETLTGSAVDYVFGGKGGNQALAAAAMSAHTVFAGRTGSDAFGEILRRRLAASAVDATGLQKDPGCSGMSVATIDPDGDYSAVIVSAANLNIDAAAITLPDDLQILLLQNEIPEPVNVALARRAKAKGASVWLNAAPARPVSEALSHLVDLMIVNQVEAAFYAPDTSGLDVLETRGAAGVRYAGQSYPAFAVDQVHSTHGAGDMFAGALAAEVSQGRRVADALPFAMAAAALLVATPQSPRRALTRADVERFLESQLSR